MPCSTSRAGVEDEHQIGCFCGREPVRDADHGTTGGELLERRTQLLLGLGVDRGGRFVEDQQTRVAELGADECDQLTLTDRQRAATLAHLGEDARGETLEPRGQPELCECGVDVCVGRLGPAVAHVVADRRVEQEPILGNHPDPQVPSVGADVGEVDSADLDPAGGRVVEATQQLGEGGLPGPRFAHDGDRCPGRDGDVDVGEHGRPGPVGEADPRTPDPQGPHRQQEAGHRVDDVDRDVGDVENLAPTCDGGLGLVEDLAQFADRSEQEVDEKGERDQLAGAETPVGTVGRTQHDRAGQRDRAEEIAEGEHHREEPSGLHVRPILGVDRRGEACRVPLPEHRRPGRPPPRSPLRTPLTSWSRPSCAPGRRPRAVAPGGTARSGAAAGTPPRRTTRAASCRPT